MTIGAYYREYHCHKYLPIVSHIKLDLSTFMQLICPVWVVGGPRLSDLGWGDKSVLVLNVTETWGDTKMRLV